MLPCLIRFLNLSGLRLRILLLVQFFNKMIDSGFEGIDFIGYYPKNLSRVDVKVVMRNNIPHTLEKVKCKTFTFRRQ